MNGLIVVNKEAGYTSRDVVNIISKLLKTKKVGHTGTLDPMATGVLVVCFNRYTKLVDMLTSLDKEYITEIKLGIETDTLDITGEVLKEEKVFITREEIEEALRKWIGLYKMEVPIYSAVKVNGKKLYQYARQKEEVELPIKEVEIKALELLDFKDDVIKLKIKVSKGTYIRSFIRDFCHSLNIIGTMRSLDRTKQGEFTIDMASSLEDIKRGDYHVYDIEEILNLPIYQLSSLEYKKVINGNSISLEIEEEIILLKKDLEEVAIYQRDKDSYIPYVMLKLGD